jgi:hypothetical protein
MATGPLPGPRGSVVVVVDVVDVVVEVLLEVVLDVELVDDEDVLLVDDVLLEDVLVDVVDVSVQLTSSLLTKFVVVTVKTGSVLVLRLLAIPPPLRLPTTELICTVPVVATWNSCEVLVPPMNVTVTDPPGPFVVAPEQVFTAVQVADVVKSVAPAKSGTTR